MKSEILTHTFWSLEEQLIYLKNKTGVSLPKMTCGRKSFFHDLGAWLADYDKNKNKVIYSYILPNPEQGMSFPTALDILSSSMEFLEDREKSQITPQKLLEDYGLPHSKLTQPVVSLSGGELLLLNFAKVSVMASAAKELLACSPIYWLSPLKYIFWQKLVGKYISYNKPIDIILLDGEPLSPSWKNTELDFLQEIKPCSWKVDVEDIKVVFDEVTFPTYHPESSITFFTNSKNILDLESPTLMTGDNGVGKSIFAKLLSGILEGKSGKLSISTPNGSGKSRLLFQDSTDQIFGKSIDNHADWVFRFEKEKNKIASSIYTEIDSTLREFVTKRGLKEIKALGDRDNKNTLLQAKMGLISERLASTPSMLILDEPGWGLSRELARKFVWSICEQANKYGTIILIISHQPEWWHGITKSHLQLTRKENNRVLIDTNEAEEK